MTLGHAAAEVERRYARARLLCQNGRDLRRPIPAGALSAGGPYGTSWRLAVAPLASGDALGRSEQRHVLASRALAE